MCAVHCVLDIDWPCAQLAVRSWCRAWQQRVFHSHCGRCQGALLPLPSALPHRNRTPVWGHDGVCVRPRQHGGHWKLQNSWESISVDDGVYSYIYECIHSRYSLYVQHPWYDIGNDGRWYISGIALRGSWVGGVRSLRTSWYINMTSYLIFCISLTSNSILWIALLAWLHAVVG